jgi:putative transposase
MVTVRYHPEDLSRVFVNAGTKEYMEVRYADLRRPAIALFEQRRALKAIREAGQHSVSEAQIFRTVEDQRRVIVKARRATLSSRRRARSRNVPSMEILDRLAQSESAAHTPDQENEQIDYDSPVEAYDVEQW